jgi:hypothetical protein
VSPEDPNNTPESDLIYFLTPAERKAVEVGLDDIRNGLVYSNEEANELLRKWLAQPPNGASPQPTNE